MTDPSTDPVGTVRREEHEDGYSIWQRHQPDATRGNEWTCVWSTARGNIECTAPHPAVADFPAIGAVPGTPAAEPIGHDVELVDKLAKASWDAADGFMSGVPWPPSSWRVEKERRRVRAMLAAYLDHPWFIGQEVEWNPRDDVWTSGVVDSLTENTAVVVFHDSSRFVIEKRHLRPALRSTVEGDIHG